MDFDNPEPSESPAADLHADLNDTARISCPYCGEASELRVDLAGGATQEYVEDCEVCCQPWLVHVTFDGNGQASVLVKTLDNE